MPVFSWTQDRRAQLINNGCRTHCCSFSFSGMSHFALLVFCRFYPHVLCSLFCHVFKCSSAILQANVNSSLNQKSRSFSRIFFTTFNHYSNSGLKIFGGFVSFGQHQSLHKSSSKRTVIRSFNFSASTHKSHRQIPLLSQLPKGEINSGAKEESGGRLPEKKTT